MVKQRLSEGFGNRLGVAREEEYLKEKFYYHCLKQGGQFQSKHPLIVIINISNKNA